MKILYILLTTLILTACNPVDIDCSSGYLLIYKNNEWIPQKDVNGQLLRCLDGKPDIQNVPKEVN